MRISATVRNAPGHHEVTVTTEDSTTCLDIAARAQGRGSAVNGGELLATALATCLVNDLYREAAQRDLVVGAVRVTVESEFGGPGDPARSIRYSVHVESPEDPEAIAELVRVTDGLAEVHNTLRSGAAVELTDVRTGSR